MAVSGIDSTIKIFNPDRNAQEQAKQGMQPFEQSVKYQQ